MAAKVFPEDADIADPFDSREFYELCQAYRHAPWALQEPVVDAFERLKQWCRNAPDWAKQ